MPSPADDFASRVVRWQRLAGRNDLPWQNTRDPYRVWLSEIMLQQTQVATVRAYFTRFVARYPDVQSLALATLDDVLGLWSGLGYYSRARNLHRCAQRVLQEHGGVFPRSAAALLTLPGIGRSTAAAIAALCFGERSAILDANVRRVLARVSASTHDLTRAPGQRALWDFAHTLLPGFADMPAYTQGMMDLGATLCTPRKPACHVCPVAALCVAHARGEVARYPLRRPSLKRGSESIWLLWAHAPDGALWLARRPVPGVWAGLHCLPLFASEAALHAALPEAVRPSAQALAPRKHVLTHKDLFLHPWKVSLQADTVLAGDGRWVAAQDWPALGLPAPVRTLLQA